MAYAKFQENRFKIDGEIAENQAILVILTASIVISEDMSYSYADTTLNPWSAGIDFSRQNLTSIDVRFWRLRSIPAIK